MDETRESCLAALLARGLFRVRQRAERAGTWKSQGNDEPQPLAADADDQRSDEPNAVTRDEGDQP